MSTSSLQDFNSPGSSPKTAKVQSSTTFILLVNGQNSLRPFLKDQPYVSVPDFGGLIRSTPFQKERAKRAYKAKSMSSPPILGFPDSIPDKQVRSLDFSQPKQVTHVNSSVKENLKKSRKCQLTGPAQSAPLPVVQEESYSTQQNSSI